MRTVVATGASGFLGQPLLRIAATNWPDATLLPIYSPHRGGIDLAHPDAVEQLGTAFHISNPHDAVLVHAAASVKWSTSAGLLENAAMALNVATWARTTGIGFCVLVSAVNVYPRLPVANVDTPCCPSSLYGLGKWTAENVWRLLLARERSAIVRLAGIWGWQRRPTLFWNRLLLGAVQGSSPESRLVVRRSRSRRNYISTREASDCLLQVGMNRMPGLFLGAGRDTVDTRSFVKALQELPGSNLSVDWQDDGDTDEIIYHPSAELLPWLKPFPDELSTIWAGRPDWVLQGS